MRAMVIVFASLFIACGGKSEPAPAGKGEPAKPAAAKLDKAKAQAVADGFSMGDGWEKGMASAQSDGFMLSFAGPANAQGGKVNLIVAGLNCMMNMCADLTKDAWKKNEDNLEGKLSKAHRENPALVWELGETEVDGKKAISVYSLSFVELKSDSGTSRMSTHSYELYWHNGGGTLVNITASADANAQSLDELKAKVTKDELEAAAKKAFTATVAKL